MVNEKDYKIFKKNILSNWKKAFIFVCLSLIFLINGKDIVKADNIKPDNFYDLYGTVEVNRIYYFNWTGAGYSGGMLFYDKNKSSITAPTDEKIYMACFQVGNSSKSRLYVCLYAPRLKHSYYVGSYRYSTSPDYIEFSPTNNLICFPLASNRTVNYDFAWGTETFQYYYMQARITTDDLGTYSKAFKSLIDNRKSDIFYYHIQPTFSDMSVYIPASTGGSSQVEVDFTDMQSELLAIIFFIGIIVGFTLVSLLVMRWYI